MAESAVQTEQENRYALALTLARCFLMYELGAYSAFFCNNNNNNHNNNNNMCCENNVESGFSSGLPKFSTTAILFTYLWQKYSHQTEGLDGYVKAMDHLGALHCSVEIALSALVVRHSPSEQLLHSSSSSTSTTTMANCNHHCRRACVVDASATATAR
ncbi:hypothetical protein ACA910_013336 [Epithemia clementina (nom. ined.)]